MTWTTAATAAALTFSTARLRRRVQALPVLAELDEPDAEPGPADSDSDNGRGGDDTDFRLITVAGARVAPATVRAGTLFARDHGLAVLDLVPADLAADRLLDLVRQLEPATYTDDVLASGRTAAHALLVSADLLERAGIEPRRDLKTVELHALAVTLKEHWPYRGGHAIAPGLCAVPDFGSRWERHRRSFGSTAWIALAARLVGIVALVVGARRRRSGALALAVYQAQPLLVTAGTAARPLGRWHGVVTRSVTRLADAASTALAGRGATDESADMAARRSSYPEVAAGVDLLLEDRRDTCPVCGGTELTRHTTVPDLLQDKPGRFRVDRCRGCRTVLQNPRLTIAGLDFYYRDFYDGLAGEWMAQVFSGSRDSYQGRVDLIGSLTDPQKLLDVGTGQGHFCLVARETWPDTVIDGLDFTPNVDLAERRGRIDHAFNGLFPELAPKLEDEYDVVTMHHYLEHTRDPGAELDAAALVVRPGGYLEIEVPNPDSWLGRRLGRYWMPLLQPQHQHLIPLDQLSTMLVERGFTPVASQLAEAHQPVDLGGAAYLAVNHLAPRADLPWSDPPGMVRRVVRPLVVTGLFPVVLVGFLLDRLLAPWLARSGAASAYRVIARRDGASGSGAGDA